jgi:hypothetical protein
LSRLSPSARYKRCHKNHQFVIKFNQADIKKDDLNQKTCRPTSAKTGPSLLNSLETPAKTLRIYNPNLENK